MIVSVVKINNEELNKAIDEYVKKYSQHPYLFMNGNTNNALANEYALESSIKGRDVNELNKEYPKGYLSTYHGYKIFKDPTIEDGKVEIR